MEVVRYVTAAGSYDLMAHQMFQVIESLIDVVCRLRTNLAGPEVTSFVSLITSNTISAGDISL